MNDEKKTKAQLLEEIADLRQQVQHLKAIEKPDQLVEEKYRSILENIEDGYYEVDLSGKYTFVNRSVCRYHGRSPEDLLGRSYREFMESPEEAQRVYKIFNRVFRTGTPVRLFQYQIINQDKGKRDLEMSASLMLDSEGNPVGFRGIGRDITGRKKLEAEQERYRDFVENIEDGCYELDLEGNYTFVNEAACRRFGFPREEFLGLNHSAISSPETAKKMFKVFNEIYRTGQPSPLIEDEIFRKDGSIVAVQTKASLIRDADGNPVGFRGVSRDITERKRLEAEQERYRDFVDNISDWCFELDLDGKFTFVNDAFCQRTGFSRENLIGSSSRRFAAQDEIKSIQETLREVIKTGLPKVVEYKHIRPNGEKIFLQTGISLIRDPEGKPNGFRCVVREITELKTLEQEKERALAFVENITDGCFEVDLGGNMTFFNEPACRMFGYPREEFMGMNNRAYTTPETAKKIFKIFNEIYRTGVPAEIFDYEIIRKNGEIAFLEMSASLIRDEGGNPVGFRGISRDITERKKLEAENERFRNYVENITEGCFELDLKGNITFANEALSRIYGYPREDDLKKNYRDLETPETAEKLFSKYNEIFQTGRPSERFEYEIKTREGEVRLLETTASLIRGPDGNPVGFRGICRDITERKKMEAERERYRDFVESIADGCYEQDLAGNYSFVNEAACQMYGYSREEFLGLNYRKITTPEIAAKQRTIFNQAYRTGQPTGLIETELIRKDGKVLNIQTKASLILDSKGNPIGFRGVSRDMTEQTKIVAEAQRLTEQLNQARKLEAIGTLAGGVAHDFNNLLMGIQGYTSLMLLDIDSHHPFYEKLKAVEGQIKNAADLTGQLLGFARGGRYEVKPTDMNHLIATTASLFGRTKKEIRIHQTLAKDLWLTKADQGQMEQVLLNLFMNAWQAMPGGGTLYLRTENTLLDESYVEPYEIPAGPFIKISVTDTGMGMDQETRARIFEPFFTTKEMGRGTGLGLATAYGIITGHGGIINVYSEKGFGTTFNIYLPASQEKTIPKLQPAQEIVSGDETLTLLLVDDEKMITEVTGTMLTRLGYKLLIAHSGEEAVEIYRFNSERIHLIIMDLIMPGIGGGKAFDLIRSINPQAKIILSSGFSLNGEALEVMNRGAQAFIQKPFLLEDLSRVVKEVLETA